MCYITISGQFLSSSLHRRDFIFKNGEELCGNLKIIFFVRIFEKFGNDFFARQVLTIWVVFLRIFYCLIDTRLRVLDIYNCWQNYLQIFLQKDEKVEKVKKVEYNVRCWLLIDITIFEQVLSRICMGKNFVFKYLMK